MSIVSVRLIHPLGGFIAELEPHLTQIFERYQSPGETRQDFVRWIIARQLEMVWGIYCFPDCKRITRYLEPYAYLQNALFFEIAQCFTAYFKNVERYPRDAHTQLLMLPNDTIMITYTFNQPRYAH